MKVLDILAHVVIWIALSIADVFVSIAGWIHERAK